MSRLCHVSGPKAMESTEAEKLYWVQKPDLWPLPPEWMSFSAAKDIETCPRRWALRHGTYPAMWNGDGYPPRVGSRTLRGRVVHRSIESVLKALRGAGCTSVKGGEAVGALKSLGGFTKVVERQVEAVLGGVNANPRLPLNTLQERLEAAVPSIREEVQAFVSRLDVVPKPQWSSEVQGSSSGRRPLGNGTYAEMWLQAACIGWGGYADLIAIEDEQCMIGDFKTGEPKEEDADQVRLYSLLWWLDEDRNPDQQAATSLQIYYPRETVSVSPPTEEELQQLREGLVQRDKAAREALQERPPAAYPRCEQCNWCGVRHLCEAYWQAGTQEMLAEESSEQERFVDAEIKLLSRRTKDLWEAEISTSMHKTRGDRVLFERTKTRPELQELDVIRVLGARKIEQEQSEAAAFREGSYTEVFVRV